MSITRYRLEDIATVNYGERVVRKRDGGTKYPVYGGGGATFAIDRYNRENCYIVSRFGMSERCVREVRGRFFLNDSGLSVETRDPALLRQDYLDAYLLSNQKLIFNLGTGAAQKNLNVDKFRNIEVPVPSFEDQARVIAIVNDATDVISALESVYSKTASKLTDLRSSALASAIAEQDWPLVPLGEVVELAYGRALPAEDRTPDGVVPVFGANGIKAFTDQALHNEATIIVGRKGSVGELVRCEGPSWALDVAYYTIPDSTRVDQDYLYYWLTTADLPSLAKGVKPGLNRNEVYAKDLPLPPLEDQARIVALLDEVSAAADEALSLASTRLEAAKALRQSILESAFRGEL